MLLFISKWYYQHESNDNLKEKLRNYLSEYEITVSRLNKVEDDYINKKSLSALDSQSINVYSTQSKEKSLETRSNMENEVNVNFDKNLNLELMKQYVSNEDSSKYQNNEIIRNGDNKNKTLFLIAFVLIFVISLVLIIYLAFKQ